MEIGFIGLGAMGSAMAANLVRAGHQIRIWNRTADSVAALIAMGAQHAAAPSALADAECLVSMLADDRAVRAVLLEGGVIERLAANSFHVNMATISVALAGELTIAHGIRGSGYVAAPVLGRPEAAAAGNLAILAAGPASLISRARPIFEVLGRSTWLIGHEPAQANAVKLAMNVMLVSAVEAMAEATALVQAYGVHAVSFIELLTRTLFPGPVYGSYGSLLAERRYQTAGFKLSLGLKDVQLALEAGDAAHVRMPFVDIVRDRLCESVARGHGELDLAALAEEALRNVR